MEQLTIFNGLSMNIKQAATKSLETFFFLSELI